jgi:3-(3-hydroxy-phenyl)propionate hydroxylase
MTMVNMAGQRRRWEIMLMPGDDPETIAQPASVWPLLARWIGPGAAEIERAAVYTFHSVIAHGWRKERLLIAGDAAHQTPPFLGQGMCAGIRDASNLAWKLARVLRSEAPEALLDSYESERLPHVRAFIELAVRVGGVIQATDRELAAERDRRFAESGPEIFSFPAPQLGPGAHAGGEPPVAPAFPQPRLDDDRPMDQAIGARFALILRPECMDAIGEPACARLMAGDVRVLAATGGGLRAWLDEHGAQAVLIRPDRYVAGLARQRSDIDALARLLPHV